MHRALTLTTSILVAVALTAPVAGAVGRSTAAATRATGQEVIAKARLAGWVARRDGYHLYREGSTVKLIVNVRPDLSGEDVRARLEYRRPGAGWRLLDVSSTRLDDHSHQSFRVRGLPAGYSFRIRVKVPPGEQHGSGRSPWRYFRVG